MVGRAATFESIVVRSLALIRPCLELFPHPYSAHVPSIHISYYSLIIILVSAPFSSSTLAVSMREVSCVGYTPRASPFPTVHSRCLLFVCLLLLLASPLLSPFARYLIHSPCMGPPFPAAHHSCPLFSVLLT